MLRAGEAEKVCEVFGSATETSSTKYALLRDADDSTCRTMRGVKRKTRSETSRRRGHGGHGKVL